MKFNADFLVHTMHQKKMTDQDLAFEMCRKGEHTSTSSVSLWKRGKAEPRFIKTAIMAEIFGVPLESFKLAGKN